MELIVAIRTFLDLLLDNAKKLFYPEEWVSLDLTLSKTEVFCLLWMERNTDITMTKIADLLDIPMSTTTGVVNRLVKRVILNATVMKTTDALY